MFSPTTGMISREEFLEKIIPGELPRVRTNKKVWYYNIPAAFDIEVSSFYKDDQKQACMYIWQFGILNWVTYGRTWDEFKEFLSLLSTRMGLYTETRLIVYVHNLAYEFQFIRKHFDWDKIFLTEERKPLYALYEGIEFRCSLRLSSKSLANVGKDLQKYKVEKKVGDLDYSLIRTSESELTRTELGYCENDIRVILSYIQEKIESDGSIISIPLTNTGYVRKYCKRECFKFYKNYIGIISGLRLDPIEYTELKLAFSGGFTHASADKVGIVFKNVGSFDFTSSYPAVMLLEKFPMSTSRIVESISSMRELNYYLVNYCCIIDITFYGIAPKVDYDHPLSSSKTVEMVNAIKDNGRIVTAEKVRIVCTELDLDIYNKFYTFDNFEVNRLRIYEKEYLPKAFIKSILELYKKKTILKGVDGEEINYMISKNMLNSAFGMAVTDIMRLLIEYVNDEYSLTREEPQKAIDRYNNSKTRFLFYPWGVWVTAYARHNLFSGILACKDDYIYADTDSIKILNPEKHMDYINSYNEEVMRKIHKVAETLNLDVEDFAPKNKKGVSKPIGVWDYEGTYDKFKTLGAKRYMVEKDGKYSITVAGLHKKDGCKYLVDNFSDPFEAFNNGMEIPAEFSGRKTLTYVDDPCEGIIVDYNGKPGHYEELSYIHMEPSEYHMDMSVEYKDFLNKILGRKDISF